MSPRNSEHMNEPIDVSAIHFFPNQLDYFVRAAGDRLPRKFLCDTFDVAAKLRIFAF